VDGLLLLDHLLRVVHFPVYVVSSSNIPLLGLSLGNQLHSRDTNQSVICAHTPSHGSGDDHRAVRLY
jgi:hypothetical protein